MTVPQKITLVVAVIVMIAAIPIVVSMASAPTYSQLYSQLSAEDANTIVEKLKEQRVPYRLTHGGSAIDVPSDQADTVRIALAGEGLPQGGKVGYEIFEKPQLGTSEFSERLNYLRALQGELGRTIEQLRSVRSATVQLALPERRLYAAEEKQPGASVLLDLANETLSPKEVRAVIHLVATAVEGLEPENVTVVDTAGNLLSDLPNLGSDAAGNNRMQIQRQAEVQVEQRVQSMLDRVLGPNKSVVRANVKINFNRARIENETYTPAGEDSNGVLESEHWLKEEYGDGAGADGRTLGMVGAVGNTTPGTGGASAGKTKGYSREDKTSQYRVNKRVERIEQMPGDIQAVSLSVFVDEKAAGEKVEELQRAVAAAAGVTVAENSENQIVVTPVTFDDTIAKEAAVVAKQEQRKDLIRMIMQYGIATLVIVVFLGFLLAAYRSVMAPVTAQLLPEEDAQPLYPLPSPTSSAEEALQHFAALEESASMDDEEVSEDIQTVMNMNPERIAQVIKGLITEENA
jgi:flagellar M-ring protein FliF